MFRTCELKKMSKQIFGQFVATMIGTVLGLGAIVDAIPVKAATSNTNTGLGESWSFGFENYPISHQGQAVIDLTLSYDYVDGIGENDPFEYPEFTQIYNYIDTFFTTYPNETDFWEILNKNLVTDLLSKPIPTAFGFDYNLAEVVDNLTVEIDVHPGSSGVPYSRSSTVTGIVSEPIPEPFTVLGGITAISFGAFFKNQVSKTEKTKA